MSTGSTADFALTRNDIISSALRKIGGWPEDGNVAVHKIREAIRALNMILRQEDLKQTGLAKSLWATDNVYLPLAAGRYIFTSSEGLSTSIQEIVSAVMRDVSGGDTPIDWISKERYDALNPKNQIGDPTFVYLQKARLLADQKLYIWPAPSSITTSSDTVIQSEKLYTCILKHTSASENKPGSGASWRLYWKLETTDETGQADTWATATDYANGPFVVLGFKRPLYDFDSSTDNPDFPLGWENYLALKLAINLAPDYGVGGENRTWLRQELAIAEAELMPSARTQTSETHNHTRYF